MDVAWVQGSPRAREVCSATSSDKPWHKQLNTMLLATWLSKQWLSLVLFQALTQLPVTWGMVKWERSPLLYCKQQKLGEGLGTRLGCHNSISGKATATQAKSFRAWCNCQLFTFSVFATQHGMQSFTFLEVVSLLGERWKVNHRDFIKCVLFHVTLIVFYYSLLALHCSTRLQLTSLVRSQDKLASSNKGFWLNGWMTAY